MNTYRPGSQAEMHAQPPLTPPDPPCDVDWDDRPQDRRQLYRLVRARLVARKSDTELKRQAARARRKAHWTQEDLDAAQRAADQFYNECLEEAQRDPPERDNTSDMGIPISEDPDEDERDEAAEFGGRDYP